MIANLFGKTWTETKPNNDNVMLETSKKLYVLCVGINKFKGVSDLHGCENDAENFYAYLEESSKNTEFKMEGKLLLSEKATKENIVNTFLGT